MLTTQNNGHERTRRVRRPITVELRAADGAPSAEELRRRKQESDDGIRPTERDALQDHVQAPEAHVVVHGPDLHLYPEEGLSAKGRVAGRHRCRPATQPPHRQKGGVAAVVPPAAQENDPPMWAPRWRESATPDRNRRPA